MMTSLEKLSRAEKWLAEAKSLDELKQIHDIAIAADAYAKAHRLGLQAQNHAMEIRFLAARRIGELVPATPPEIKGKRAHGKELPELRATDFPNSQRLSEFRKLAEIPLAEYKQRIEGLKERDERITYSRIMAGSHSILSSESYEWWTPAKYIEAVWKVMGQIDLDPASCEAANETVRATKYFGLKDDGLKFPWKGKVFLNPPYGAAGPAFVNKMIEGLRNENITEAILLVNSRATDAEWFQPLFDGILCFTDHRIDFDMPGLEGKKNLSTHGSCFVYFGPRPEKFATVFAAFGNVVRRY